MKYVRHSELGIFLFPDKGGGGIIHRDIKNFLDAENYTGHIISAGFVFFDNNHFTCRGYSQSIGIGSHKDDSKILNEQLVLDFKQEATIENQTKKETKMSLEYIRNYYRVPAKKGKIVAYKDRLGIITGASGAHVEVLLEDQKFALPYHPEDLQYDIEAKEKSLKKDIITLVLRLKGEDPDTFSPEASEAMERWLPKANKVLRNACFPED